MTSPSLKKGGLRGRLSGRRAVGSSRELVRVEPRGDASPLPRMARPGPAGVRLADWLGGAREEVESRLHRDGGILFRGFGLDSPGALEEAVLAYSGSLLEYTYRSTPRQGVQGRVYTSTHYPSDQAIPLHNENSYSHAWPRRIWFLCLKPGDEGGETPLADSRKIFRSLDPALRRRFADRGVLYVRNYGAGLDLPWQEVFQTSDREEVEAFCRRRGIDWEWYGDDRLRTRQVSRAVLAHPVTGEDVWFNQAHLFHVTALPPEVREPLLATCPLEELPRNTYYGDGSPIEADILEEIRGAYDRHSVSFPWQAGDLLLLDNLLIAHGRRSYRGERQVVVAMSEPMEGGG